MKGWQLKPLRRENWDQHKVQRTTAYVAISTASIPFKAKMPCKHGYIGNTNMLNLFRKISRVSFTHSLMDVCVVAVTSMSKNNTPLPTWWSLALYHLNWSSPGYTVYCPSGLTSISFDTARPLSHSYLHTRNKITAMHTKFGELWFNVWILLLPTHVTFRRSLGLAPWCFASTLGKL